MATLRDTIGSICTRLTYEPHVLRLRYLVFLVDWTSAVLQGRQLTTLRWMYGQQGPLAEALSGFLRRSREFKVEGSGDVSATVVFEGKPVFPTLNAPDRRIIEEIVKATEEMDWARMQRFVYQSDPLRFGTLDQFLDLEQFARNKFAFPFGASSRAGVVQTSSVQASSVQERPVQESPLQAGPVQASLAGSGGSV